MKRQSTKRLWQFHRELSHLQSPPQHPCHGCGEIALVKILAGENRTLKRKARALERENLVLRAQLHRALPTKTTEQLLHSTAK